MKFKIIGVDSKKSQKSLTERKYLDNLSLFVFLFLPKYDICGDYGPFVGKGGVFFVFEFGGGEHIIHLLTWVNNKKMST